MVEPQYNFGPFTLVPARRQLLRDGTPVEIGARSLAILLHLVANAGAVIEKADLMRIVWEGRFVEDNNLTVQISALRRLLGTDASGSPYVRTLPGRGYVFVADVSRVGDEAGSEALARPSTPASRTGLPQFPTVFIGRETELADLAGRLQRHRLSVVTGIGGVGKSRLVIKAANDLMSGYSGGVVFVDLARVSDSELVGEAVAAAVRAGGGYATADLAIVSVLRTRTTLLVLDNGEHVTAALARLCLLILAECPLVTLLVTSRESLRIAGEQIFRLAPLSVPPATPGITAAEALTYDAVRLFVSRASALLQDFVFDDACAPAVAESCRRLDGISLAIEMLVPRLQVLTAQQIAERLHERFRLLASAGHDILPRQRTLRTMFDWSWELLRPAERLLLERLAVFSGGALLSAAVAMGAPGMDEWETLDGLTALVDKSLVSMGSGGSEPRYLLLQTTRQYVLERLTPTLDDALRRRHAEVIAARFEQAEATWPFMCSTAWTALYGDDADNLRAAREWAFGSSGEVELGLRLVAASYPLWWELASLPLRESQGWFDVAVARIGPETPAAVRARLWLGHSWRDVQIGDVANRPSADRAIALFRALGEPAGLGAALWRAGSSVLLIESLEEAVVLLREAECVLRTVPPSKWLALTLIRRGDALGQQGDNDTALSLYDEALAISRETSHWLGIMLSGNSRAEILFRTGHREAALAQLEALRAALPRGRRTPLVSNLATYLASAGRRDEALDAIREVVDETPAAGLFVALARAMETLAMLLAEDGGIEPAARMLGFVLTIHQASRNRMAGRLEIYRRLNTALDAACAPQRKLALFAEGAAWSVNDALDAATRHLEAVDWEALA